MYNLLKSNNVSITCIERKVIFYLSWCFKISSILLKSLVKTIDLNSFYLPLISLAYFPETEANFCSEVLELCKVAQTLWVDAKCTWTTWINRVWLCFAGSHCLATCKHFFAACFCSGKLLHHWQCLIMFSVLFPHSLSRQ